MLLRNKRPNAGLYNGVGGKIEPGELPLASVLREVREETGITLATARFGGIVTWGGATETGSSGMYVYVADAPTGIYAHKLISDEGRLSWLASNYVLRPMTPNVVDNIPYFLNPMLVSGPLKEYRCSYDGSRLCGVTNHDLDDDVISLATQEVPQV